MKKFRTLAFVLCAVMALTAFLPSVAQAAEEERSAIIRYDDYDYQANLQYRGAATGGKKSGYRTPEEKIATMKFGAENDRYLLLVHQYTGEVCLVDKTNGQMLFTNPYDVAYSRASAAVKNQLLSQLTLKYSDSEGNTQTLTSYLDAAMNDQILAKRIRGGIRVEYTIGEAAKKRIVPRQISKDRFEEELMRPFYEETKKADYTFDQYYAAKNSDDPEQVKLASASESFEFSKFLSFYSLYDINDPKLTMREQNMMAENYPITKEMAIYIIADGIATQELITLESYIRQHTKYSLEDMLSDHELVGYEMEDDSPAVFRMALEYTLTDQGLQVRLPARGISYDAATYTLEEINILPYMGAGRTGEDTADDLPLRVDDGYNFIPDGSGAIVDFKQNTTTLTRIALPLFGDDFGFYSTSNAQTATYRSWQMPVFGTVFRSNAVKGTLSAAQTTEDPADPADPADPGASDPGTTDPAATTTVPETTTRTVETTDETKEKGQEWQYERTEIRSGYVAIITEGESLARIDSVDGAGQHEYHSVSITVFARQTDSYPLDGITVSGGTAMYTKAIPRKYVGNYTILYRMLEGDKATYLGMADSYRQYLLNTGALKKIDDLTSDIPMYLDLIGEIDTTTNILGIPVSTKTEITTFEDARAILDELKAGGVKNQIFRYLGWANGGMAYTVPSKLSVESKLGGEEGLREFISYARSQGMDVFLDLDFSYAIREGWFDGFDKDEDTAKTIDGKTAYYKTYNPIVQAYNTRVAYVLSAKTILPYYEKITEKYGALYGDGKKNISVGTLGKALNSSQDEDYPLNREDAKVQIVDALKKIASEYDNVLLEKGNSYTWAAADHLLEIPLDSSNRANFTEEVPFIGIVLHGYVRFTGEALNLAGDYRYTILKTIENGASPYFVLAYENNAELKTNGYGHYYAVDYATWKDSILEEYEKINTVLGPLQGETIIGHDLLSNRIVKITYANGVSIYLNYNNFDFTVTPEMDAELSAPLNLEAMGFEVVK